MPNPTPLEPPSRSCPWRPLVPPLMAVVICMVGAVVAGALVAMIAAVLDWWRKVPVVLSTLQLNFIVIELLRYLIVGPMRDPGAIVRTRELLEGAQLPVIGQMRLGPGIFFALASAALVWLILGRTTFGFRLRV